MDDIVSIKSITWTKSHKDENDNIDETKQDGWGKALYGWNLMTCKWAIKQMIQLYCPLV
jgi:hypothetical protein